MKLCLLPYSAVAEAAELLGLRKRLVHHSRSEEREVTLLLQLQPLVDVHGNHVVQRWVNGWVILVCWCRLVGGQDIGLFNNSAA